MRAAKLCRNTQDNRKFTEKKQLCVFDPGSKFVGRAMKRRVLRATVPVSKRFEILE
jgi:hypothetical protein